MRFLMMVLVIWAWMAPAQAQDKDAVEDVISDQLQAFVDRDVARAWTHASPMIQGMFGTATNFGQMVERGYPMVWDNAARTFQDYQGAGEQARQKVFIRDNDGNGWILLYEMIDTVNGWKINGVQVLPAPELAA